MNIIKNIKQYIIEVKAEAKKVSWPTRKTAVRDSVIVVAVSLTTAAFLGGVDYLLSYLIKEFVI
jgi:preprotein translocase subunit SecE